MSETATTAEAVNQDVSTTVITYSLLHPTALNPSKMSDVDLANHMTNGEFLGRRESLSTTPVDAGEVDLKVEALGGAKGFFTDAGTDTFGRG